MMTAAIMCGGKGSRMQGFVNIEKPLLKLKGKTMVELVIDTLLQSRNFSKIFAATSSNSPDTKSYLLSNLSHKVDILETEGIGYPNDISMVLKTLRPDTVFLVTADLPLLTIKDVNRIVLNWKREHPCTCVVSEKRFVTGMGVNPSITVCIDSKEYCYSGISIMDSSKACSGAKIDEHYLIINKKGVAVNVNTRSDFEIAEMLMSSSF
jgi:adenosylcobinamide-phosphate guanylyltransferase